MSFLFTILSNKFKRFVYTIYETKFDKNKLFMAYPFYGWMNIWIDSDTYININIIKRCPFLLITWNNWIFWISWNFLLLTNYWNQLNCWAFESSTSLQFLVFRAFLFSFKLKIFQQIKNCFYPQIFQIETKVCFKKKHSIEEIIKKRLVKRP